MGRGAGVFDLFAHASALKVIGPALYQSLMSDKKPNLTPEAERALAEAEERRKKAKEQVRPTELGGRDGPEPVRYGDWENKGIAVDF